MFCPKCGNKLDDNALFCGACGAKVEAVQPTVEEIPTVEAPVEEVAAEEVATEATPEVAVPEDIAVEAPVEAPVEPPVQETPVQPQPTPVQPQPQMNQVPPQMNQQFNQQVPPQMNQQMGGQQYNQQPPKKPAIDFSKINKFWFVIAGETLVALIMIIAFFAVNISMTSPKNVAKKYMNAVCQADYETAYKYLATDDSDFMTKEQYLKLHKDDAPSTAKYKVTAASKADKKATVNLVRTVSDTGNDTLNALFTSTVSVTLTAQDKNRMLLFKNWKVSDSSDITSEIELKSPVGTTVYIDGIEVKDKYKTDTTSEYDIYTIPSMFTGTHTYSLTIGDIESAPCEFTLYSGSNSISCTSLKFSKEDQQKLAKVAYEKMTDLIGCLIANKAYSDSTVKALFTSEIYSKYQSSYDACLKYYTGQDNYPKIESVNLTNVTATTSTQRMDDGCPLISFQFKYRDTNYGTRSGFFTGATTGFDEEDESSYVTIKYENGEWRLDCFPGSSISYNTYFQAA